MNTTAWKCHRCDLTFTEQSLAILHKKISNHPASEIKIAVA